MMLRQMGLNMVHESFRPQKNFKIGHFCIIEENVCAGDNVEIGNHVLLKSGTRIGDDTFIDSSVISSGDCVIGAHCKIRYQSIIARDVVIGNHVFFSAGVKLIYLEPSQKGHPRTLQIGDHCFLGDNVTVMHGVYIAKRCIIGANALVTKDTDPGGVYIGTPARRIRDVWEGELK